MDSAQLKKFFDLNYDMYFSQKNSTTSDINRLQREKEELQSELNAKDERLKYLEEQVQVQNQLKERFQKIKTQNIKHKKIIDSGNMQIMDLQQQLISLQTKLINDMPYIGQPSFRNRHNRSANDVYIPTPIQKNISISEKTDKQVFRTSDEKLDLNRSSYLESSTLLTSDGLQRSSMQVMPSINAASSYSNTTTGKTRSPIPSTSADFESDVTNTHQAIDELTDDNLDLNRGSNLDSPSLLTSTNLSTVASTNQSKNSLPALQTSTTMFAIDPNRFTAFKTNGTNARDIVVIGSPGNYQSISDSEDS